MKETKLALEPAALGGNVHSAWTCNEADRARGRAVVAVATCRLRRAGFEVALLETRHVKAALSAMTVKTDRQDARGLAQLIPNGLVPSGQRQIHGIARGTGTVGCAASAKPRLPPPMRSAIATIIARPGGSERRPSPPCAPTSSRSAYGLTGSPADEKEEPALVDGDGANGHEGEGVLLIFDNARDAVSLKPVSSARRVGAGPRHL